MTTIKVKFTSDGRWGDHPSDPIFEVKADEEREVSPTLAKFAVDAGKAEFVREKRKPGPKKKAEDEPEVKTGDAAENKNPTGPIPKAENKSFKRKHSS